MKASVGSPTPLGSLQKREGVNFALFSSHAQNVSLGLFKPGETTPFIQFTLDPKRNKTGQVWHIFIENLPNHDLFYGYTLEGPTTHPYHYKATKWISDPYGKALNTSEEWGKAKGLLLSKVPSHTTEAFSWEGDTPLQTPFPELIIYEMHVRGFTQDGSSKTSFPGTFLGLIEKIPHLKDLGVTAVEFLPIFEFDEAENSNKNPKTGKPLCNYWGYSTLNFFAPMPRFASDRKTAILEFKKCIKALHKAGIEVILDVVFNHTSRKHPFFGIDIPTYYLLDNNLNYTNFSGCGNTINCNHPVVIEWILSTLRYWVVEMHVDGFRFDLASIFCRGAEGKCLIDPPLIQSLKDDPVLAGTKLIAEPWDCGGLYQVGSFPGGRRFADWNGHFRDVVRKFLKGTEGQAGAFAEALCGSERLYHGSKAPYNSINFVTAHDGFSLYDLVSYNQKHNEENGENNRDGNSSNESWNCGVEGATKDPTIIALRHRQQRNFIVALLMSVGTPMLHMGDEYQHTKHGNNNTYCHDTTLNYFLWDELQKNALFYRFCKEMISLRKRTLFLKRKEFFTEADVIWHGREPYKANWGAENRLVCYTLRDPANFSDLYIAFNAHFESVQIELPARRDQLPWKRIVDTAKEAPEDFLLSPMPLTSSSYTMASYSALIFG